MITQKEVEYIAKLARIGITKPEIARLQKDLDSVLVYADKLKEVDVSKTKPTSHPIKIENVMREDEVKKEQKKLIEGFLKVKSVF